MDDPNVLLTNDDGIDSVGIGALHEELSTVAEVTVVAPATDQSAVGRSISRSVTVREHELGYAIEGTPVDCVVAGLASLVPDADVVVSGCNRGANLGGSTLGRSGTISAAVEAAFFDVPAIAVSAYVPAEEFANRQFDDIRPPAHQYTEAAEAASYLLERTLDGGVFDGADYLNVNAPLTDRATGEMVVTRPAHTYLMDATREGDTVELKDHIWTMMAEGDIPDPPGTDRRAIVENKVSVTPLSAPHTTTADGALESIARSYPTG